MGLLSHVTVFGPRLLTMLNSTSTQQQLDSYVPDMTISSYRFHYTIC